MTWISRLTEAALFCVFFTGTAGQLTAAVINAASPGLTRRPIAPADLSGWTWGELHLHEVTVQPCDILMLAAVHYLLARQPQHLPGPPLPDPDTLPRSRRRLSGLPGVLPRPPRRADPPGRQQAVQTNEVRRCRYLLPALMAAGAMAACYATHHERQAFSGGP
jgi:hypothetical protein